MKKITFIVLTCLLSMFYFSMSTAQTVFWTEAFTNGCTSGCTAATYTGSNGSWTDTATGNNANRANVWYVSEAEGGLGAGQCGAVSTTLSSLHIGSNDGFITDPGAAYDAGPIPKTTTSHRVQSPAINCTGKYGITITFNYFMNGQAGVDYGSLGYFSGTAWSFYNGTNWLPGNASLPQTDSLTCSGQGLWTSYSAVLPINANNNPNVKIGFQWVNNNDGGGSDPSIAIDSIRLSYSSLTGVDNLNSANNSISVYPTPNNGNFTLAYHLGQLGISTVSYTHLRAH